MTDAQKDAFLWVDHEGNPVSCAEKVQILRENDAELRQALQDAFDDGVLMGVAPQAMLQTFQAMLSDLKSPFQGGAGEQSS
ncbi:hypothetical protein [Gluconobacter roseus]|uniref:Uncharacterized protein n=1 Tax=Gluconobacter roseus NBRC 3990 TaxID=1307950 RepID=A0A4Y3M944_9PROT|nr:hypothetical protein [Gluconobacter roseus]KXV42571.1 hypothetical protein AD943_10730 [Gluconobacter roseus]GBR43815.1 hypothetical protein AA3990_0548 [Gluconobacter roseus NBRC 3990]GEB03988.1 hypothetical protein GRO01_15640 [Gluconobacter roseus NBRC 3990]GLP92433.1 hypothetical protein GCM10007871_04110 [Gluconobacter roseus NBRC 3990]